MVRPLGTRPRPSPRSPRPGRWPLLIGLAGVLLLTIIAGDPASESDRSANTVPPIPPDPPAPQPTVPVPDEPVPSPLDDFVPGFSGTLVMAVADAEGTQVWRWSSGRDGVIARSLPVADIYDAAPDPSGSWVAGIHRFGRELPSLQVGIETHPSPVFWGARSFVWHAAASGGIAWVEQPDAAATSTIHVGERVEDGVFFKPAAMLDGFWFATGADRLVAYDNTGFVVERWSADGASVQRLGPDGQTLGTASGQFVGISPGGTVAVREGVVTRMLTGPSLEESTMVPTPYTSVAWAPGEARFAATDFEAKSVDLADGAARRTVAVGDIGPSIMTWGPQGRFVLVSGHVESDPVIVFIDAATLDTWTILLDANPVAAAVVP